MPKFKSASPAQDSIEQDFLGALKRLQDGEPTNKALRAKQSKGILKITTTNIALEAGRSRTLIALENCRYPRVRELIKQAKEGKNTLPTTHTELIQRLRADKAELLAQVKKYKAEATAHYLARVKAEKEAAQQHSLVARLRKLTQSETTLSARAVPIKQPAVSSGLEPDAEC